MLVSDIYKVGIEHAIMCRIVLFSFNYIRGILIFIGILIVSVSDGDALIAIKPRPPHLNSNNLHHNHETIPGPPIEAFMSTPQLIVQYGYPVQQHQVRTGDGYILTMFRIPSGEMSRSDSANTTEAKSKELVLFVHGLLLSSSDWLLNVDKPRENLPMILADNGYDVWLANIRGNSYSMRHAYMNPKEKRFWKFSFDEMGKYDLPALVNYILEVTRRKELSFVGHSMGTTMFFVSFDYNPSLTPKIKKMIALCPTAYIRHAKSPGRAFSSPMSPLYKGLVDVLNRGHMMPSEINSYLLQHGPMICSSPMSPLLCKNIIFFLNGINPGQISDRTMAMVQGHSPSDQSSQTLFHYLQWFHTMKFQAYDHGLFGNLYMYGSYAPRMYSLSNVQVPVYAVYSDNDWFNVLQDTHRTLAELGNLVAHHRVNDTKFTHMDFLYGKDAKALVYDYVLETLSSNE